MKEADRTSVQGVDIGPWAGIAERVVAPGELLVREGDMDDDVFQVVTGTLEVLRGADLARFGTVGPGDTIGDIAALGGCPRMATVRALETCRVRQLDAATYRRWVTDDVAALATVTDLARERLDVHRTVDLVADLLGIERVVAAEVAQSSERRRLQAGERLFSEGDESDAAYLVVSGRLEASRDGVVLGEVGRGEIVGEVGLIARSPRSATVTALRDTTLARFDAGAFRRVADVHPVLMMQLSRTILSRLGRPHSSTDRARSIAIAISAPLDRRAFLSTLAEEITRHGSTRHLWAERVDADLGRPGLVESRLLVTRPVLSQYLHEVETTYDYLLLETGDADTNWTRVALSLADRIVVVASCKPDDDEARRIEAVLAAVPPGRRVERWVVLVHPADTTQPHGAIEIADRFGVQRVANVRTGSIDDVHRVARLVSGNATGLVLGGGGARGFAHLGVWRALNELGIDVDTIGGASIGAPLGFFMALQTPDDTMIPLVAELFHDLLDYTVPIVSLLKGERITRNIAKVTGGVDVRDVWLPFFCVSTNLTRSCVEVHDRLDAATAIRASVAIPGILPPVPFNGELLVDGGVLNNLPCDVMRAAGTVKRLIAVDLSPPTGPTVRQDFGHAVSGWRALRARLGPGRSPYPGLMSVVMRSLVTGSVRDRDRLLSEGTVDWYIGVDVPGVQLLDFERVAEIAERGYRAARPRLEALLAEHGA